MGLFGGLKSTYKKSEAAVVIQNLLEHQANAGLFDLDPAKVANTLVQAVWDAKPDVFDGKFGQRPHKITVAAAALANGIAITRKDHSSRDAMTLALGNVLSEIETNGRLYPLNSLDHALLETSLSVFREIAEEFTESPSGQEMEALLKPPKGISSWEEWLTAFKISAAQVNQSLKLNSEGESLIDLMEHGPLKRAHREGVDPTSLAREFAAQFDITTFGT